MKPPSITPTQALDVINALEQAVVLGAAPFLSVAAEQCGLDPATVAYWYHQGRKGHEAYAHFFKIVAKMRADWKVSIQAKLLSAGKDDAQSVKNMTFLLQCMDRDLFDLTKKVDTAKIQEPGKSVPAQVSPEDLESAITELAQKGTMN